MGMRLKRQLRTDKVMLDDQEKRFGTLYLSGVNHQETQTHTLKDYCRNWPTHSTGEGPASIIPARPSPLLMLEPEAHRVAVRKGLDFHEREGCLNPASILAVFLKSLQ